MTKKFAVFGIIVLAISLFCMPVMAQSTISLTGNFHGTCTAPALGKLLGSGIQQPFDGQWPQHGFMLLDLPGIKVNDGYNYVRTVNMCTGDFRINTVAPFATDANGQLDIPLSYIVGGAPVVGDGTLQNLIVTAQIPSGMTVIAHVYLTSAGNTTEVMTSDGITNPDPVVIGGNTSKFFTYGKTTNSIAVKDGDRVFFLLEYKYADTSVQIMDTSYLPSNVDVYVAKN